MNRVDAGFRQGGRSLWQVTAILLFCGIATSPAADDAPAPNSALSIVTAAGASIPFSIEVADTEALRQRGLMFRKRLPADHGMLLLYDKPRPVAIWMKDTYVSLDVIFIDGQWRIARITPDAVPLSLTLIPSGGPVRAVLEIPAGQAEALGIRVGDSVIVPSDF